MIIVMFLAKKINLLALEKEREREREGKIINNNK